MGLLLGDGHIQKKIFNW